MVEEFCREAASWAIFHWENLTRHLTASAAGQLECLSTACGEIPTSESLGMMLGGVWEIPDVIRSKVLRPIGDLDPHLIHSS